MILGTEVNEFVTNRQQSKIHYLAQENKSLQEYIQDLENALKLNKQAMSLSQKKNQGDQSELIQQLNQENIKLTESLVRQQKETSQLQTKILLQEQISEEQQNYYKDLIADLEYKLIELKRSIHDKEYAIQELERMKPIQEREGQLIKVIEVVTPSEQNLKLHEELESVRSVLSKISAEASNVQETNNILREVNYHLKREIIKMRIVLRSQVNHSIMKDFVYNEYLDKSDNNIELNKEIQNHRGKLEQLHQDLFGVNSLGYGFSPEPQQLKYLSKNERMIYQEKLHKMEMMVKGFKELFEKEKNNNFNLTKQQNELLRKYNETIDTNQLLIESNKLKDQRHEQQVAELQFYKKQNQNLMEQLKSRKIFNAISLNQEQDIAVGILSPRFNSNNERLNSQPSYFQKQTTTTQQEMKFQETEHDSSQEQIESKNKFKLKQLEIEDEPALIQAPYCLTTRGNAKPKTMGYEYYEMTKEECVNFLMSMQSDFFQKIDISSIKKKQLIKQLEDNNNQTKTIHRSYSNPFLYYSNKNEVAFLKPPKKSVIAITKSEIKVLLNELQNKKQKDNQELFNVDVSNIGWNNKRQLLDQDVSFISNPDQDY